MAAVLLLGISHSIQLSPVHRPAAVPSDGPQGVWPGHFLPETHRRTRCASKGSFEARSGWNCLEKVQRGEFADARCFSRGLKLLRVRLTLNILDAAACMTQCRSTSDRVRCFMTAGVATSWPPASKRKQTFTQDAAANMAYYYWPAVLADSYHLPPKRLKVFMPQLLHPHATQMWRKRWFILVTDLFLKYVPWTLRGPL